MSRSLDPHQPEFIRFKEELAEKLKTKNEAIESWFCRHATIAPPPFYSSVDLRDSGKKIVPVDSNLFPAGFNNLCPEDQRSSPAVVKEAFETLGRSAGIPSVGKILIIPESHTSNAFYIENLHYLSQIVANAGFETRVGWIPGEGAATEPFDLHAADGKTVKAYPFQIGTDGRLDAQGFAPDLILLNNDFSGGYPPILDTIRQPIVPSHKLGWHARKKSEHFRHYNRLAAEFAELAGIDPWAIQIETREVDGVNFAEEIGIEPVAIAVDEILQKTRAQYQAHGITTEPFVFVKNNAGTYGMGIMVVHSAEEVRTMNRRTKNKMSVGKNKRAIESLVIQEGVPTATLVDRLAAEPVAYLIGDELIGGFLRTNTERGTEENLNSQGMVFRKLCMNDLRVEFADERRSGSEELPVLELVYGSIARISALAAGYELKDAGIPGGLPPQCRKP